jgi:hypothetical protein
MATKKQLNQYKLNGKIVSQEKYLNHWDKVVTKIEKLLGVYVVAYGPGMQIADKDYKESAELPQWLIDKLVKLKKGSK